VAGSDVVRLWKFDLACCPNCIGGRAMGILIDFPTKKHAANTSAVTQPAPAIAGRVPPPPLKTQRTNSAGFKIKAMLLSLLKGLWASVWLVLVCLWPLARWIVGIDLCFQLIRTVYYWNTPDVHGGWTFLLHFTSFAALTYLVAVHRPAGFRDLAPMGVSAEKA
jgi:Uncharacterized KleE stable inheritance protein